MRSKAAKLVFNTDYGYQVIGGRNAYVGKETKFQVVMSDYLTLRRLLYCHIANERVTSPQRGAHLKRQGVKKGMPDILLFEPFKDAQGVLFVGAAVELKVKGGTASQHQKERLKLLAAKGWKTILAFSPDDLINWIEKELLPNRLKINSK